MMDKLELLKRTNDALSLMKRMGEDVDTSTISLLKENLSPSVIINEGLIRSYNVESVVSFIGKAFNLRFDNDALSLYNRIISDIGINTVYDGEIRISGNDTIKVTLNPRAMDKCRKLDFYFRKYGYILSRIDDDQDGQKTFYYEKKFAEEIFMYQLLNYTNCLYHVTNSKNKESILKRGLRTKSATDENGFMHDERIYLFLDKPDNDWIDFLGWGSPLLIKVDITKLPGTYKFYFDPRVDGALYTFENIPPEALETVLYEEEQ